VNTEASESSELRAAFRVVSRLRCRNDRRRGVVCRAQLGGSSFPGLACGTLAGYYVGREFKFAGIRGVWMASQGQIKFLADDGAVSRVVALDEQRLTKTA
jgi:hypothetical protein